MKIADNFRETEGKSFGLRLKARRKTKQLTLKELAELSSVSASTISKVENGAVSPSYDVILGLATGLDVPIGEMFGQSNDRIQKGSRPSGWLVSGRSGESERIDTKNYEHHYLCSDLKTRLMVPTVVRLKSNSLTEFEELTRHSGEEFIYVLKGRIELHSEFYATSELSEGDYAYLDSTMGHAYVAASDDDAVILCICAGQSPGEDRGDLLPPPEPANSD